MYFFRISSLTQRVISNDDYGRTVMLLFIQTISIRWCVIYTIFWLFFCSLFRCGGRIVIKRLCVQLSAYPVYSILIYYMFNQRSANAWGLACHSRCIKLIHGERVEVRTSYFVPGNVNWRERRDNVSLSVEPSKAVCLVHTRGTGRSYSLKCLYCGSPAFLDREKK